MSTSKTRINISLPNNLRNALFRLARRDRIPKATKAVRLLETALEIEEDQAWDMIAKKRDVKGASYIAHPKAWG